MVDKTEAGPELLQSDLSPFLYMRETVAFLRFSGKIPCCKDLLKSFVNGGQITSAESLTSLVLILSGPVDFNSFNLQSNFKVK